MTYTGVVISAAVGVLIGAFAGRFISKMPPGWDIAVVCMACAALFTWVFYSLRELKRRKRVLDDLIAEIDRVHHAHRP
jgi:membrane protein DedA with SNARE-associated domain